MYKPTGPTRYGRGLRRKTFSLGVNATQGIPRTTFNQTDWQVTPKNRYVAQLDPVPNNLILAPSATTAPAWSDISGGVERVRFNQHDQIPNSLILGIPTGKAPFIQTDWPNPLRARAAPQDFQSGVNATQGIPRTAFNQTDWPNPLRARATPQDFQIWVVPFSPPPVVTTPFNNLDWQMPVKIRYYAQQENISNQLGSGILTNRVFRASAITNPQPKVKVLQPDPVPNSLILGIPPAPVKPPFVQSDWANPVRAKANPQDYQLSGTTTRGIPYIPPVVPNIFNFDWPNPRRKYDLNGYGVQISGSIIFNSPTTWSIIPALPTTVWSPVNDFQSDALTADNTYVTADSTIATADGYAGANQWVPISTNTTAWTSVNTQRAVPPIEGGVM